MLYLCDNQALLEAVKRWVGKGGKATLLRSPDADILREELQEKGKKSSDVSGQSESSLRRTCK